MLRQIGGVYARNKNTGQAGAHASTAFFVVFFNNTFHLLPSTVDYIQAYKLHVREFIRCHVLTTSLPSSLVAWV